MSSSTYDALPDDAADTLAPVNDRLTTTLFLAALFHGIVILGVTFAVPKIPSGATPTLEVLLLTGSDTRAADNLNAEYLAQRNQQGSGTTDDAVRPANPASSSLPLQQEGLVDGSGSEYREATSGQRSNEYVTSRADRSEVSYRSGEDSPANAAETPLAL